MSTKSGVLKQVTSHFPIIFPMKVLNTWNVPTQISPKSHPFPKIHPKKSLFKKNRTLSQNFPRIFPSFPHELLQILSADRCAMLRLSDLRLLLVPTDGRHRHARIAIRQNHLVAAWLQKSQRWKNITTWGWVKTYYYQF